MAQPQERFAQHLVIAPMTSRTTCRKRACELPLDERAIQLADIVYENDSDAAECAAADLFREFPDLKG
jgi:hypothetical protein